MRMKHVIEYTSAKPTTAGILGSAWKQKAKLKDFRAKLQYNYTNRDTFWNKLTKRACESTSLEKNKKTALIANKPIQEPINST